MAQLIILVDEDAKVETLVRGAMGSSCTQLSADFLTQMGTITNNVPTAEYYAVPQQVQQQQQQEEQQIMHVNRGF